MKFVSWNVNGLRAIVGKGFEDTFKQFDADFVCLREIKLQEGQLDLHFDGYDAYYSYAERKGYSVRRFLHAISLCRCELIWAWTDMTTRVGL